MQEKWVESLDWGDPLEKELAIHTRILAWKSHGQRSLVGYSPWGCKRVRYDWANKQQQTFHCIYAPHLLYPFVCSETLRWLPCLGPVTSIETVHCCLPLPWNWCPLPLVLVSSLYVGSQPEWWRVLFSLMPNPWWHMPQPLLSQVPQ